MIGNKILESLSKKYADANLIKEADKVIYKTLAIDECFNIKFREWGYKPYFLILFLNTKYIHELDLLNIVKKGDKYFWYFNKPTNENNIRVYERLLGNEIEVPSDIRDQIIKNKSKYYNANVFKKGYCFANGESLDTLTSNLKKLYDLIKKYYESIDNSYDILDKKAIEGYEYDFQSKLYKRNSALMQSRKIKDNYTCQACNFKLKHNDKYIIECHHINPLFNGEERETKINDLISLCPTCHRIAHTRKKPYTITEIKKILKNQGK